ncbi:MAG: hypothetical protein AAFP19_21780 [Bacteroidota bacterium]
MKLNYLNRILRFYTFSSLAEAEYFFENQKNTQKLFLTATFGDYHCVVKCMNSLSMELEFCLGFSSETKPDDLILLPKYEADRWIVQVDNSLFLISPSKGKVIHTLDFYAPLIGLYSKGDRILALEEVGLKVFDINGKILQSHRMDLPQTFELKENTLLVTTSNDEQLKFRLDL